MGTAVKPDAALHSVDRTDPGCFPPQETTLVYLLVLFLACLLAAALSSQRFFHPLFLARFQIEGVTFHFLDDVLLLYLPFEAAKRILKGFALLNPNFRQKNYTPLLALTGLVSYGKHLSPSQEGMYKNPSLLSEFQPHRQLDLPRRICAHRLHEACRLLIISRIVSPTRSF